MLPRRSSVLRTVVLASTVCALLVVWFSGPERMDGGAIWRQLVHGSLNMTELRSQFDYLKRETNSSISIENKTMEDVYNYIQDLKKSLPVNPHKFKYLLNPEEKICGKDTDVFLLTYIHTAPEHYKRRTSIRDTWGNTQHFKDENVRLIFLLGVPKDQNVQDAIAMESDMYGDIVQEDFADSYRNLTYKAIMGLKWISQYCKHARYLLKADDDIFVNIFNVVSHLKAFGNHSVGKVQSLLLCLVWYRMKVVRDSKSKWYLSKEEFTDDYFPTYCSGSAFMLTTDVAEAMYRASFKTPFFWVDDFYVTGLLAAKVGVTHQKFNSVYSLGPSTFLEKFTEAGKWRTLTFGHVHNLNHMTHVWNKVLSERSEALDKLSKDGTDVNKTTPKTPTWRFVGS